MEFFVNDLSIHGQFQTIPAFREAFGHLMALRTVARRYGREVYCHRMLANTGPAPGTTMQRSLRGLGKDKQRAAMSWMTRGGSFWDDLRRHGANDWLESGGEIVTDTAVGEAAFRTLHGVECGLVSVTPSDWDFSPVEVVWIREAENLDDKTATLENWRDAIVLEERLRDAAPSVQSWEDLREASMNRFDRLVLARDCFDSLDGVPFAKSAAERFLALLDILDKFARAFDATGVRTAEGHRINRDYFSGDNALFSDSSDTEKRRFHSELTFRHPNDPASSLFCTWHGKVKHLNLRLHYSWSGRAGEPVYVVYAGPKITKQ